MSVFINDKPTFIKETRVFLGVSFRKIPLFSKELITFIISFISLFFSIIPDPVSYLWIVVSPALKALFLSIFTGLAADSGVDLFSTTLALLIFRAVTNFTFLKVPYAEFGIKYCNNIAADSADDNMGQNIGNDFRMVKNPPDCIILHK